MSEGNFIAQKWGIGFQVQKTSFLPKKWEGSFITQNREEIFKCTGISGRAVYQSSIDLFVRCDQGSGLRSILRSDLSKSGLSLRIYVMIFWLLQVQPDITRCIVCTFLELKSPNLTLVQKHSRWTTPDFR